MSISFIYELITETLLYIYRFWRKANLRKRRHCQPSTHAPIKSCFTFCLNRDIPKKKRKGSWGRYSPSWNTGMCSWQLTIQMWTSLHASFIVCYWYDLAGKSKTKVHLHIQKHVIEKKWFNDNSQHHIFFSYTEGFGCVAQKTHKKKASFHLFSTKTKHAAGLSNGSDSSLGMKTSIWGVYLHSSH